MHSRHAQRKPKNYSIALCSSAGNHSQVLQPIRLNTMVELSGRLASSTLRWLWAALRQYRWKLGGQPQGNIDGPSVSDIERRLQRIKLLTLHGI